MYHPLLVGGVLCLVTSFRWTLEELQSFTLCNWLLPQRRGLVTRKQVFLTSNWRLLLWKQLTYFFLTGLKLCESTVNTPRLPLMYNVCIMLREIALLVWVNIFLFYLNITDFCNVLIASFQAEIRVKLWFIVQPQIVVLAPKCCTRFIWIFKTMQVLAFIQHVIHPSNTCCNSLEVLVWSDNFKSIQHIYSTFFFLTRFLVDQRERSRSRAVLLTQHHALQTHGNARKQTISMCKVLKEKGHTTCCSYTID